MERKTKKVKKDGDTCRDCWTKRFRKDLCKEFKSQFQAGSVWLELPQFLNRELKSREDEIKAMREVFADLYDEIGAIEHLAGDVYMDRYDKEKEKED
jgi:hypothetical protein